MNLFVTNVKSVFSSPQALNLYAKLNKLFISAFIVAVLSFFAQGSVLHTVLVIVLLFQGAVVAVVAFFMLVVLIRLARASYRQAKA